MEPCEAAAYLAVEKPITLVLNGTKIHTFMCTPENLDFMALGYLRSTGLIRSAEDVAEISVRTDIANIRISCTPVKGPKMDDPFGFCLNQIFNLEDIRLCVEYMFANAEKYRKTGGMHCAAIVLENGNCMMFEDVGRHNAIDKAIGYGLSEGADFSRTCILSSGRIALEIVSKIAAAGIPLIVSRSIPTTAAYELAKNYGISLIGRIGSEEPIFYTWVDRIARPVYARLKG